MSIRLKRINKALLPMDRTGGKYACPFCPKKYHFKHSLKDHINSHTGSQPHVCKHCRRTFSHLASLCMHIKRCHYNQMPLEFECDVCKDRFLNRQSLKQHITRRHGKEMADTASQQVATDENVVENTEVDGGVGSSQVKGDTGEEKGCADQGDLTEQAWDMSEQTTAIPESTPAPAQFVYQNNNLQAMATDMAIVKRELDVTRGEAMSSSGTPMVTSPSLFSQLPAMTLPPMSSPLIDYGQFAHCLMSTPPSSMAQFYHRATATSTFIPASAPPSMMSLQTPTTFERTIDGKFQCPYCVKSYNFKHTLKDHINKHMGKRPHVCKHCGDTFTHLASLCAHIKRRHAEHMPDDYKCEICHDKFMNYQSLKQHHTWRHRDKKPPHLQVSGGALANTATMPSPTMVAPPAHTRAPSLALPSVGAFMSNVLVSPPLSSHPAQQQNVFPDATALHVPSVGIPGAVPSSHTPSSVLNNSEPLTPTVKMEPPSEFNPYSLPDLMLSSADTDQNQHGYPPSIDKLSQSIDPVLGEDNAEASAGQLSPSGSIMAYFEEINYQTEYGLYRYKCRLCSNVFKIKNSLYEHVNSHLGKKPHVCSVCAAAFTHHSSLHNHMRNKHTFNSRQEKEAQCKIPCPTCGRKFRYPSELDRHFNYNPDHDRPAEATATSGVGCVEAQDEYLSGSVTQPDIPSPSQVDCFSKEQPAE